MGLWSRLFDDPMEPLTAAILKAARQDTFGVASYGGNNNPNRAALLMCEFEFTSFYISYALSLALAQMDPPKAFAFEHRVKFSVLSKNINAVLNQIGVPPPKALVDERIKDAEKMVRIYRELLTSRVGEVNTPHALNFLALRIAMLTGDITTEQYKELTIHPPFHEGVKNVVEYNLSAMKMDSILDKLKGCL
jgi:hypothetical protein